MSPSPTSPGPATGPSPASAGGDGSSGSSSAASGAPASFIKLAMRNMVRKGSQSLLHFGLTALGLSGFLVLIAWLGRPNLPQ